MNTLIVGCGDIGLRLAKRLHPNRSLYALVRSDASRERCEQAGLQVLQCDFDSQSLADLSLFDDAAVFYFAPPPRSGQTDSRLTAFLQSVGSRPQRIVLISTTGVYGDCGGDWVDESRPPKPVADRAMRRADAERCLQDWAEQHGRESVVLRVPGIYAQDRLPLARLLRGEPVLEAATAPYTNRIHADDLALVCDKAMQAEASGLVMNVSDGNPSTMTGYFNHVADFAGIRRPPQVTLEEAKQTLSAGMLSYLAESRRIDNQLMLQTLDVELQYPTLAAALPIHFTTG